MKISKKARLFLCLLSVVVVYASVKFAITTTLWLFNHTQAGIIAKGGGVNGVIFFFVTSSIIVFSIVCYICLKFFISMIYTKHGIEDTVWQTGYSGAISHDNSVNLRMNYESTYGAAVKQYALFGYCIIGLLYCLKFYSYIISNPINFTDDKNINLAIRSLWTILTWPWNEIEPHLINIRL